MGTTVFDVVSSLRPLWTRGQVQGLLGAFGFSGDTVQRRPTSVRAVNGRASRSR